MRLYNCIICKTHFPMRPFMHPAHLIPDVIQGSHPAHRKKRPPHRKIARHFNISLRCFGARPMKVSVCAQISTTTHFYYNEQRCFSKKVCMIIHSFIKCMAFSINFFTTCFFIHFSTWMGESKVKHTQKMAE